MKKNIIILSLLALVIAFSVTELFVHKHIYTRVYDDLLMVDAQLDVDKDNLTDSAALQIADDIVQYWRGRRWWLTSVSNNAIIRLADEHLARLRAHIAADMFEDAKVQTAVTIIYFKDLIEEINPRLTNIF